MLKQVFYLRIVYGPKGMIGEGKIIRDIERPDSAKQGVSGGWQVIV